MRTVPVKLRLIVDDVVSGIGKARGSVRAFGQEVSGSTGKSALGFRTLGTTSLAAGGAIAFGLGKAIGSTMSFDKAMSGVAAVSNATVTEMGSLRDAAIEAGKATVFSATESAQAEAELARAGVSTADILGGALRGSLDLAAAGQLGLADAATISAQAMNVFKLEGKDVAHIADVLAAGANKSAADVGQLGDALRQGGLVAAQTGLDLEDTVGVLSAFADRALIGSDAGTSLKTMLQRLTPQSAEAASEMERLGISAYDASGQFVGIDKFAQNLQDSLAGLTVEQRNAAMATIFGSDAVRAANVLYELGGKGVREYTEAVNDQGAAQRMAATQLDNLAGDLEQLRGSFETALIQSGSKANSVLRTMTQTATSLVNVYIDLPGPLQAAATGFTAVAGGIALVGGAALIALPRMVATKAALDALGISAGGVVGKLSLLTGVIGAEVFAAQAMEHAWGKAGNTLEDVLAGNTKDLSIRGLGELADALQKAGVSTETFSQFLAGNAEATKIVKEKWEELKAGGLDPAAAASKATEQAQQDMQAAMADATGAIDDQKQGIEDLNGAFDDLYGQLFDAEAAQDDLTSSIKDGVKRAKEGKLSTLELRDAGRNLTKQAYDVITAMAKQGASTATLNAKTDTLKTRIYNALRAMGMSKDEARRYAGALDKIPGLVSTTIQTPGLGGALADVQNYSNWIRGVPSTVVTTIITKRMSQYGGEHGGLVPGFAGGGSTMLSPRRGPTDVIPAWLAPREFVVNARDTARNLPLLEAINRGAVVTGGGGGTGAGRGMPVAGWDGHITLDIRTGASDMDQYLAGMITKYVRVNASGNVQAAFGQRR
jgi:TP901 family phage tail tape measure protein